MKYKIIKQDEEETIIEKSGFTHQFTVAEVIKDIMKLEVKVKELTAQKELEEAKMSNIVEHNKFLEDMNEEDKHAVFLYYEAKNLATRCDDALKNINQALKEYDEVKADVKKQTGLEI